jgi:hypothetical protein
MNTSPESGINTDQPPAGTPCIVCQAAGHWCQGDVWCTGDSGKAICDDCANGRDCEVIVKRKQKAPLFEPEEDHEPVAPVRSVPVPPAVLVNGHDKESIALSAPVDPKPTELSELPNWRTRVEAIARRLLELEPGQTITLAVPEGLTLKAFDRGLIQSLAEYVPTADIKWIHGPDRSGTRLLMATENNPRKRVRVAPMERPAVRRPEPVKVPPPVQPASPQTAIPVKGESVAERRARAEARWSPVLEKLLALDYGADTDLDVPPDDNLEHFTNNLRSILHQSKQTRQDSWSLQTAGFGGKVHVTRIRRNQTIADIERAADNPKARAAVPELTAKDRAAEMLSRGYGVKVVQERTGLDRDTVAEIKRGLVATPESTIPARKSAGNEPETKPVELSTYIIDPVSIEIPAPTMAEPTPVAVCVAPERSTYRKLLDMVEPDLDGVIAEIQRLQRRRSALEGLRQSLRAMIDLEGGTTP